MLLALAAKCKPTFNREVWPAKYVLFLFLVTGSAFIPNDPLFSPIYMQMSRVFAALFVVVQQIIFIDIAYNWNESWVIKSNEAEAAEAGTGNKWLGAILAACGILFAAAITGIGLLFGYFRGCGTNEAFISLTLIFSLAVTAIQLSGTEASLLTSAIISAYATYLAYVAVSANPNEVCNPKLGESNTLGIVLGIGLTLISLAWTGYSWTAHEMLTDDASTEEPHAFDYQKDDAPKVKGVVTDAEAATEESHTPVAKAGSDTWKLNVVLAFISSWYAMILTGWGSIGGNGDASNPQVSSVSMWMVIASQWLVFALYIWTIMAPRLFPDREFS